MNHKSLWTAVLFALASTMLPVAVSAAPKGDDSGLRPLAERRHMPLGVTMSVAQLEPVAQGGDADRSAIVLRDFDVVEPASELRPDMVWLGDGHYAWQDATADKPFPPDFLLGAPGQTGWAQQNKVAVRGTLLICDSGDSTVPAWIKALDVPGKQPDKKTATRYLQDYITAVMGRYKGKVGAWDVVNLAVQSGKSVDPDNNPYNLTQNLWYRWIGPEYVDLAFLFAHDADPDAQLYCNDFNDELQYDRPDVPDVHYYTFNNLYHLVKHLRADDGIPVDVGMQYHIDLSKPIAQDGPFYRAAQQLKDDKIDFALTALDVRIPVKSLPSSDPNYGQQPQDPADLDKQADKYHDVMQLALSFSNCRGVVLSAIDDKSSGDPDQFFGSGAATLRDGSLQPKPAYQSVKAALQGR